MAEIGIQQKASGTTQPQTRMMKHGIFTIRNDLREFRYNLDQLQSVMDNEMKLALFNDTIKLFSQFDVAEEVVLYPSVRNLGLQALADTALEQTIQLENILYELDQKYGSGIEDVRTFNTDIGRLREVFNTHACLLEGPDMLPRLESRLTPEDVDSLSLWFDRMKSMAPTRPHPGGPHSTAGKLLTGPVLSFVDRFRDLVKQFTKTL